MAANSCAGTPAAGADQLMVPDLTFKAQLLAYVDEEAKTRLEYDRPSSLLGRFNDDRIDAVAALPDRKVEERVAAAVRQ